MNRITLGGVLGMLLTAGVVGYVMDSRPIDSDKPLAKASAQRPDSPALVERRSNLNSANPSAQQMTYQQSHDSDYLFQLDDSDVELFRSASQAADAWMHRYPADFAVRWLPVLLKNVNQALQPNVGQAAGPQIPTDRIRITPFPDLTFIAKNAQFRESEFGFSWRGRIVEGGSGEIIIHSVPDDDMGRNVAYVTIDSDFGDFRIEPTGLENIYVMYEANRFFNPP